MGTLIFHIMAALAQMERDTTAERTVAGIAAAKERGTYKTRGLSFIKEQWDMAVKIWAKDSEASVAAVNIVTGLTPAMLQREKKNLKAGMGFYERFPYEANREKK